MENNTESKIKQILDSEEDHHFIDENYGTTFLMLAVSEQDTESMGRLLDSGVDINIQDHKGKTALIEACLYGSLDVVKMLVANGANVNMQDNEGYTALSSAFDNTSILEEGFTKEHQEIIRLLLENGADVNLNPTGEMSILSIACALGEPNIVQLLIDNGADVNAIDDRGITPLFGSVVPIHLMIEFQKMPSDIEKKKKIIIGLLVENGADINTLSKNNLNLLMFAAIFGDTETIEYLIELGADVNVKIKDDMNILAMVLLMSKKMFELVSFQYTTNIDILFSNFEAKREDIARLLIKYGADVNYGIPDMGLLKMCTINKEKMLEQREGTIVEKEAYRTFINSLNVGDINVARFLLENGADINLTDSHGVTVLMNACSQENIEMVKLLLEREADVHIENNGGFNAYTYGKEDRGIAKLLINHGVNPYPSGLLNFHKIKKENSDDMMIKSKETKKSQEKSIPELTKFLSETPLSKVLQSKDPKQLRELINSGYCTSHVDLFDLIREDYPEMFIRMILNNGTNVNVVHKKTGWTPLIFATVLKRVEVIKMLITHDADVEWKTKDGKEAYWFSHNQEIIKILLNWEDYQSNLHRPKNLIKILTNFTKDTPIKYTTHMWDFGDIKSFQEFMEAVSNQWQKIDQELSQLSPTLHKKIYNFLLNKSNRESWCSKADITIGWSSLDGLEEWCNNGNDPFYFKLPEPILVDRKTELTTFGQVIELFKQEIEVRRDFNNLNKIFRNIGDKLDNNFTLTVLKLQRQFYTDVEKFTITLDRIFDGIKKHSDYRNIEVTANELDDGTIELKITQIDSLSTLNVKNLFKEMEDGDFADIKASLTNLCDWCVEGSFEDSNFRINYLKSNNVKDIVELDYKPDGFTHILRFYKR